MSNDFLVGAVVGFTIGILFAKIVILIIYRKRIK